MPRAPARRAAVEATGDDSSSEGEKQGVASNTHGRRTRRTEHLAAGAASSEASIQAASTIQAKTNKTSRLPGYDCRLQEINCWRSTTVNQK
ncbi:unnamed protein product [Urochloa humidicola]